jgi:hypothetical protein
MIDTIQLCIIVALTILLLVQAYDAWRDHSTMPSAQEWHQIALDLNRADSDYIVPRRW